MTTTIDNSQLEAKLGEVAEAEAALSAAKNERRELEARKPELAARSLKGDKSAAKELKEANERLAALADAEGGYQFELARLGEEVKALEIQDDARKQDKARAELEGWMQKREEAADEVITLIRKAGDVLSRAGECDDEIARLQIALGDKRNDWKGIARRIELGTKGIFTRRGRHKIDPAGM
jgi:chromosome segregation ATPase